MSELRSPSSTRSVLAAPPDEEAPGGRCAFVTYGCRLNQYDTQAIREELEELGVAEVPEEEGSLDLVVVNSCTVTARAGEKVEARVRALGRRHPEAQILVTGCVTDEDRSRLLELPGVEHIVGNEEKDRIASIVRGVGSPGEERRRRADRSIFRLGVRRFAGHTRAFVKVQDGCDSFCSYCIIPYLRGSSRSRAISDVVEEGRRVAEAGHREVVLTGIHLRQYGRDLGGDGGGQQEGLLDLLHALRAIEGLDRVRLSSIGERAFTPRFLEAFAEDGGLCPSFHIPLQSGCDETLRRMGRDYSVEDYLATIEAIRTALPRAAISTDLMVGFPGEDDDEFHRSLETCERAAFSSMHVFPYSPRPRTRAARLPGHVDASVKQERAARARHLAESLGARDHSAEIGSCVDVLVERRGEGLLSGLSREGRRVEIPTESVGAEPPPRRGVELRARVESAGMDRLQARWTRTEPWRSVGGVA
jgi:threonylcarbamoyladenosine tRNA methylthiotransferase MtaB